MIIFYSVPIFVIVLIILAILGLGAQVAMWISQHYIVIGIVIGAIATKKCEPFLIGGYWYVCMRETNLMIKTKDLVEVIHFGLFFVRL